MALNLVKMKFLYTIITVIASLALTACVDDAIVENNQNQWQQGDVPYYITFRLKTQSETFTRAEEETETETESTGNGIFENFENGTEDVTQENKIYIENKINDKAYNFAIFFDADDRYLSWGDLYSVKSTGGPEAGNPENDIPQTEATYSCRFYGFADSEPAKVLVVVNAPEKIYNQVTDFPGWNIDEVMKQVWNEPGTLQFDDNGKPRRNTNITNGKEADLVYLNDPRDNLGFYKVRENDHTAMYFTMTNATYVKDGKQYCAEEIPEPKNGKKYITTEENESLTLDPVTIYLERMVSKFSLTPSFDTQKYLPVSAQPLDMCSYSNGVFTYTEYKWGIQLLAWGLNGLETSNYLFKNLPMDKDSHWLEDYEDWNSTYNHRSYWSEDPHYRKDPTGKVVYPWQYDFGRDKYDIANQKYYNHFHSYDNNEEDFGKTFALTYYPFQWFCPQVDDNGHLPDEGDYDGSYDEYSYTGNEKTFYTPENTFMPGMTVDRSRGSRAYELAGTHVILCARLLLPDASGADYQPYDKNLYRNRVGVSYIDEVSMLEDFMNAVNYKLRSQKYLYYKYYPWDKANSRPEDYGQTLRAESSGIYTLYYENPADGNYYELTWQILKDMNEDPRYKLYREADAVNADGKVIPWIRYNYNYNEQGTNKDEDYKPLTIYILQKDYQAKDRESEEEKKKQGYIDPTPDRFTVAGKDPKDGETIDVHKTGAKDYIDKRKLTFEIQKGSVWEKIDRDDNDLQSLFYEIWGVADCFMNGLMYYAVPINAIDKFKQPAIDRRATLELDANQEFANEERLKYYYGVIRNNWYKFNLHSIKDIGIPVSNPTKPIVPNYHNKKDQIKVEMEIMQWHIEDKTIMIDQ